MAFRVAISGLKAASGELDVIGNNIANSNTTGFKKSRAEFVDVFAVTNVGGSSTTPGSGVRLSAIRQQFTQGNVAFTDNNLDFAINGSGFFILDDGGSQIYSRGGAFGVDRDGFLANAEGQSLIAFGADAFGNITGAVGPIQVNTANIPPQASANMTLDLNLDAAQSQPPIGTFSSSNPSSFNHSTSTTIYDSLGNSHLASMYYVKSGIPAVPTTVATGVYTDAVSDGTPAVQNDSLVGGAHTTSVATAGATETFSITVDGQTAFAFTSTPNTASSTLASGAHTTSIAAAGAGGTYSITVDGTLAASVTKAANTPTTTLASGAFTTITQGGGSGETYSLTVDGVAIYSETEGVGDGSVTAAEIDGANGLANATVIANLAAAGITVTGSAVGNNLVFSKTDGTAFNVDVVNDTGADGFLASADFATGTNAASNAGTAVATVTAAEVDAQITANTAALNAAGITFTGTAVGGDLAFSRVDGAAFNTTIANSFGGTAGGFTASADFDTVGANAASNAGTAADTVTAADIDTGIGTNTAALTAAGITVSGTAAAGTLQFSRADGTSFDAVVANTFGGTAGGFAGADLAIGTNTINNGAAAILATDTAFTMSIDGTQFFTEAAAISGTVTGAELDSALATFVAGSAGAYTIASGSFATDNLVLSKADGSTATITIDSNFSATPGAFGGTLTSSNGTPAVVTNTWDSYAFVDGTQVGGPDTLDFTTAGALSTPAGGTVTTASFTPAGGGAAITLTLDYSDTTQYGSDFSVNALAQDGFTTGRLSGLDIDSEGIIFARFTNGQSNVTGQLALANFANQQGLQPASDTAWSETFSSGAVTIGAPGTASLGLIQAGALEQSNVDLSEELVNMIIAQRSFQANAEVISTADAVTQSIINLR